MTAWTDLPFARRHWPDAQAMDDARLTDVLTAAQEALVDFAPALPDGSPVPLR